MVDYESIADDAAHERVWDEERKHITEMIVTIQPPPIDVHICIDWRASDEKMLAAAIESLWLPDIKDYDLSDIDIESSSLVGWDVAP